MNDGRKRIRHVRTVIAGLGIAVLGGSILLTVPSQADPDIDDVQARVDALYHEAEQASERYNVVRTELKRDRQRLHALRGELTRQRGKVSAVRDQVAASVVAQSQGQTLTSTSQVLLSESPDQFLSQMSSIAAFDEQRSQMMRDFAAQADELEQREVAAQREVASIVKAKRTLAAKKAEIDDKAGEAAALLAELEAEERARLEASPDQRTSRGVERAPLTAPAPVAASGGAGAAVEYALAQVGDSYAYGATGESAFDCSGLTMRSWAQGGVTLTHSSSGQMSSGAPVSQSELQPGDLVFYYSPVSHVGIYVGNGQVVHAANPSTGVSTAPVNSMPYSGAVRPG